MHDALNIVIFCDAVFSSFEGSMNGICWAYSRIPFVGARKKQLPSHLGLVSIERKTPLVGQIWLFVIAVLMLLPDTTSFQSIIDYLSPWTWVSACGVFGNGEKSSWNF